MQIEQPLLIEPFELDCLQSQNITVHIARLDRIHPLASGNKLYKLLPLIQHVKANNFSEIISFGGAFSNHIHALALMGKEYGIQTRAYIRGESHYAQNPTLSDAISADMKLSFLDRQQYKKREDPQFLNEIQQQFPQALIVGEGGDSDWAAFGCEQISKAINLNSESSVICLASGTGVTAAGVICGLQSNQHCRVYHVLKDETVSQRIEQRLSGQIKQVKCSYSTHAADFGGYAKLDKQHVDFILLCLEQTGVLLDPIYTSKMCRALMCDIESKRIAGNQQITMLHTGGLQGWKGMQQRVESIAGKKVWLRIREALASERRE